MSTRSITKGITGNIITMMESIHQNLVNQLSSITLSNNTANNGVSAGHTVDRRMGEALVKRGLGKTKVRKGQTDEEYQQQLNQFRVSGPVLNTITWLEEIDLTTINPNVKSDRAKLENLTERLYFKRDYAKCLETTNYALDLFNDLNKKKIQNEIEELIYLKDSCLKMLESSTREISQ